MNSFKIIVPFYNVEKWISYNIRSIKAQNYKNYKCIFVSDQSTDDTLSIIESETQGDDRFVFLTNPERTGALGSTSYGIDNSDPQDEDIIIVLDGDDWFSGGDVLEYLNEIYEREGCWMTYGSYREYPSGKRGKFSKRIPQEVINERRFREIEWMASHLRTFKYKLWRRIRKEDIRNSEGKIYPMAGDLPVMFPMLEMSGDRSHYIDKILHIYNRTNPSNEDKVNHQLQLAIEREVRLKKKYDVLGDI